GEELDVAQLGPWLRKLWGAPSGAELVVEQFPGGHSNLTYLVKLGEHEAVLRRPPFGSKVKSAHDMGREHRILSRLQPVYPRAPRPIAFCDDTSILGAPFYLMERIRGLILRREPPRGVIIDEVVAERLSESIIDTLVELHAIDWQSIGLGEI